MMKRLIAKIPFAREIVQRVRIYRKDRREIRRLKKCGKGSPVRLVVGASGVCDDGWVYSEIEYLNLLNARQWRRYFRKNSIDAILAEHVWEHLTPDQGLEAARRCFEYLKPGGYLRVAVPDGNHPNGRYIEQVKPGGTGAGADDHKVLYTQDTLADLFQRAGFNVSLLEYFDSEGRFHCVDWNANEGKIYRSRRFDERNSEGTLDYTSIIIDAHKKA